MNNSLIRFISKDMTITQITLTFNHKLVTLIVKLYCTMDRTGLLTVSAALVAAPVAGLAASVAGLLAIAALTLSLALSRSLQTILHISAVHALVASEASLAAAAATEPCSAKPGLLHPGPKSALALSKSALHALAESLTKALSAKTASKALRTTEALGSSESAASWGQLSFFFNYSDS